MVARPGGSAPCQYAALPDRPPGQAKAAEKCEDISVHKCSIKLSTGITLAYVEVGAAKGKTVIMIHGLTDSIRSWFARPQGDL